MKDMLDACTVDTQCDQILAHGTAPKAERCYFSTVFVVNDSLVSATWFDPSRNDGKQPLFTFWLAHHFPCPNTIV